MNKYTEAVIVNQHDGHVRMSCGLTLPQWNRRLSQRYAHAARYASVGGSTVATLDNPASGWWGHYNRRAALLWLCLHNPHNRTYRQLYRAAAR